MKVTRDNLSQAIEVALTQLKNLQANSSTEPEMVKLGIASLELIQKQLTKGVSLLGKRKTCSFGMAVVKEETNLDPELVSLVMEIEDVFKRKFAR